MKQTVIMLVVLGTFIAGSSSAHAESGNPFGFETDKHPLEYEYCKKEPGLYRGHGYKCSSAPRPHPDLEEYALQFVEEIGLCFIVGHHKGNPSGLVNDFRGQIAKKYGPPTEDKGYPDNISWDPKAGFSGLGDVVRIELGASHYVSRKWVEVAFVLVLGNACLKKIDAKANHAF